MGVTIRRPYCVEDHADFFVRNITVCKGDLVASAHGDVSEPVRIDPSGTIIPLVLSIDEAKKHIRYDLDSHTDDDQVEAWIRAAQQKVERDTGVVFLTSQWRMFVNQFPSWSQALYLPIFPVQSVDAFTYVDSSGVEQDTFTGSPLGLPYLVDYARPVRLSLAATDDVWPSDLRPSQPGTIDVTAGWTDVSLIPDDLKQAMRTLIGQMALFREQDVAGQGMTVSPVSLTYDRWIAPWVLPGV